MCTYALVCARPGGLSSQLLISYILSTRSAHQFVPIVGFLSTNGLPAASVLWLGAGTPSHRFCIRDSIPSATYIDELVWLSYVKRCGVVISKYFLRSVAGARIQQSHKPVLAAVDTIDRSINPYTVTAAAAAAASATVTLKTACAYVCSVPSVYAKHTYVCVCVCARNSKRNREQHTSFLFCCGDFGKYQRDSVAHERARRYHSLSFEIPHSHIYIMFDCVCV